MTSTVTQPFSHWSAANVTPPSQNGTDPVQRDSLLAVFEVVLLSAILVMALVGNGLVLVVLLRKRNHSPLHQFMLNLCLADLVVALFQVLPQLVWDAQGSFPGPDFLCRLVKYLQVLGMFASSYMIVAMTVDRHYAICCPLQAHRSGATQNCNSFILVAWALSLLLSLPQVFIFSRSEVTPGNFECWGNFAETWGLKAYVTWMTLAIFILPVFIITVCQIRIFREIHNSSLYLKPGGRHLQSTSETAYRHDNQQRAAVSRVRARSPTGHYGNLPRGRLTNTCLTGICDLCPCTSRHAPAAVPLCSPQPQAPVRPGAVTAAMSKTVRMTLVIVVVYSLCWAPYFIVQLWAAWDPQPPQSGQYHRLTPQSGAVFTLLMLLASLNSCTNPWIYSAFSTSVAPQLRMLLHCHSGEQRRGSVPNDSTSTHVSNL